VRVAAIWTICCASIISFQVVAAQESEREGYFPDLLASGSSTSTTVGTFASARYDFVVCRGKGTNEPPPGRKEDEIESGVSAGAYNDRIVADAIAGIDTTDSGSAARFKMLERAAENFRIGLKKDPQFFPFLYNLGRVLLLMNLPEQSLSHLTLARARLPDIAVVYLLIGRAHSRLGDAISAAENFRVAYRKNPFDPIALVALGDLYLETGAYVQAREAYTRVLKQFPENASALTGLGRLFMKKGELIRARSLFESVRTTDLDGSERNDYDRSLHFFLAEVCSNLKDYREAVNQYDRLLKHPEDPFFLDQSLAIVKKRREISAKLAAEQR